MSRPALAGVWLVFMIKVAPEGEGASAEAGSWTQTLGQARACQTVSARSPSSVPGWGHFPAVVGRFVVDALPGLGAEPLEPLRGLNRV